MMDIKNEYIHRMTEMISAINSTQETLKKQKEELKKFQDEYADRFGQFKPGTKIKVTTPAHNAWNIITNEKSTIPEEIKYGFVDHNEVFEDFSIRPVLYVCKKDGTRGKYILYYSRNAILEEV